MKAMELYIKYDLSATAVIRELGYPNRKMLARWYKEYKETGDLHKQYNKKAKYTPEQKKTAVDYYLEHGRNISRTVFVVD
jgi:putative transposase